MTRAAVLAVVASLGLSGSSGGTSPGDAAAAVAAVAADWEREFGKYAAALDAAKTAAARRAVTAPDRAAFAGRFVRVAEAHPGTSAELSALCWAALNAPDADTGRKALRALTGGRIDRAAPDELLDSLQAADTRDGNTRDSLLAPAALARVKRSLDHPRAARLLAWVCAAYLGDQSDEPPAPFAGAAELIADRFADSRDVSHFAEALFLHGTPPWADQYEKNVRTLVEKNKAPLVRATSRYALAAIVRAGGADRQAEAETLFRRFVAEYDGKKDRSPVEDVLLDKARGELDRIERCGLGKPAPEAEGEDLDGRPLKLSEYRGKVVLLVFWAGWCGPCLADVPHEKALVEKFRGRPFVLVGVNGDEDKGEARKAVARLGIPWRSVWNGPRGAAGPVAKAWAVGGWPAVFVIDHEGVIRHDRLRGKRLDKPLEALVAAAEAAKANRR
jgi:thiol-disulfide isomerase/thioredoxin